MHLVSVTRASPNCQGTIVLMHGLGSDEQDMFGLAEQIDGRLEVICLRAPRVYGPGFAWFDIDWTPQGIVVDADEANASVAKVSDFITDLHRTNLIVGGFSQGAMIALGVIHQIPGSIVGGALLSGRDFGAGSPPFEGKVFQGHGTFDDVISIREAHQLREALCPLGDNYEFHQYDMGHWICDDEIRDLNHWLVRTLDLK